MDKVELKVMGVTYNPMKSGAYALLLREVDGQHRIPIVVGVAEAQSIAMRLENVIPPRPMSHDVAVSMMHAFGISLEEVMIHTFREGIFLSELKLTDGTREISLDSRTSDAIALALRTGAPIYTNAEVLRKTGILMDEDTESPIVHRKKPKEISDYTIPELEKFMQRYVEQEKYERAAEIQKLIEEKKIVNIENKDNKLKN